MDRSALLEVAGFGTSLLVKAAVILTVAWIAAALLRSRSAAVRHAVWGLALFAIVLLPLLSVSVPAWTIAVPDLPTVQLLEPAPRLPRPMQQSGGTTVQDFATVLLLNTAPYPSFSNDPVVSRAAQEVKRIPIEVYALILWAGGVSIMLIRLLAQVCRVLALARFGLPLKDTCPERLVGELACALGIRRNVQILRSERVAMPITWGVWRPVILLPVESAAWPLERLRVVLLHELAHIKRLDYFTHLISELACAFYWPNPLVWVAHRRVHAEQERACDDRVLSAGTRSFEYAEHLLEIARAFHGSRRALGGTIAMAREVSLKARVRAILDRRLNRRPVSSRAGLLIAVTLSAVALPLAALRPGSEGGFTSEKTMSVEEEGLVGGSAVEMSDAVDEVAARYVWIEAEEGSLNMPMRLEGDLDASGGRFIEVADDMDSRERPPMSGRALYRFEAHRAGAYTVWGRVATDDDDENSFWVRVDTGRWIKWNDIQEDDDWHWAPVHDSERWKEIVRFDLAAGQHTLEVAYREDDVKLDRLLITDDVAFVPEGRGPHEAGQAAYVWMEAERARLSAPMRVEGHERASGGYFVRAPEGSHKGEGVAVFTFRVAQPGPYAIWGRAMGPEGDENSFFISLDGGREVVWDIPGRDPERTAKHWTWDPLGSRDKDGIYTDPIVFHLDAGTHSIRVRNRESGTKLDALLVTNDLTFSPHGGGPMLPPASPAHVWLEAEDTHLPPSMQGVSDTEASGGRYVAVKAGRKSTDAPPAGGRLTYRFNVPQAGRYLIWGRVIVPDDESDSFWVRVNGGSWVRWNGIRESDHWRWALVHDADYGHETVQFELPAGPQTLEIAYREGDVRLDKLLVTNDPSYKPGAFGPRAR